MLAISGVSVLLGAKPSSSYPRSKKNNCISIIESKCLPNARLQLKANSQVLSKINGSAAGMLTAVEEEKSDHKEDKGVANQLPDWSTLLASIAAILLGFEKPCMMLGWKPAGLLIDSFGLGRITEDGFIFRQSFSIRSYEVGEDRKAYLETLMNQLQEGGINYMKAAGLICDGFGTTPQMFRRNLLWVVVQTHVTIDRYPMWGETVEVDTWLSPFGMNKVYRNSHVRDSQTGETLATASSVFVTINKHTRKLCKMPDEVREEMRPYFVDRPPIVNDDGRKLSKLDENTADEIRSGITPGWDDLDVNEHVNNVKYIGWILKTAPEPIVKSHELSSMTIKYMRECGRDNVLQSLIAVSSADDGGFDDSSAGHVSFQHLLRLEDGQEILRARTQWRPKRMKNPQGYYEA